MNFLIFQIYQIILMDIFWDLKIIQLQIHELLLIYIFSTLEIFLHQNIIVSIYQ